MDIYRVLHPVRAEYSFLSSHEISAKINHILSHKAHLNRLKKKKKSKSYNVSIQSTRELKQKSLTEIQLGNSNGLENKHTSKHMDPKRKEELKKHLEVNENENIPKQNLWTTVKAALKGKHNT